MGQFLNQINQVPVGNIFSVGDLEKDVFKTSTISDNYNCPSIIPLNLNQNSNIKVSITPENIKEMPILLEGLEKLNRSDPAVNYYTQSNGEHILVTSGEVHLERCIRDLEDELAKVKFKISAPIVNFKEGLNNLNYTFKKKTLNKKKELLKLEMEKEKIEERKKIEEKVIEGGINNIDYEVDEELHQKEILKTCNPMYLNRVTPIKKQNEIKEHKIKDVISKNEKKTSNFIQKHNQNLEQKGFAEGETPNKLCSFGITAVGMNQEMLDCIEKNQKLIDTVEQNDYFVDTETYMQLKKFKEDLIQNTSTAKLKKLLSNYIFCFGTKEGQMNMLLIKRIPKKYSYFERIKYEGQEEIKEEIENTNKFVIENKEKDESNKIENKESVKEKNEIREEKLKKEEKVKNFFDENTLKVLKEKNIPIKEFLNSLKMGFELAIKNGPLCEENMYGVIFVLEFVEFKQKKQEKSKEKENEEKNEIREESKIDSKNEINDKEKLNNLEIKKEIEDENSKNETKSNSKSQTNEYGPLIGQIIGSIKDCCRKAYLCAEPRLYEAYYLCVFQINQDCLGKIYSVFGRRRGEIINEVPSEESIKSTIEAILPVAESFGFVEEIRKKSSGLANPMLQFYKWKMLNVDPFDITSEEDILNYGVNVDNKNIAKNYINEIRRRKGLLTNEKLVSGADKQRNLAKKK